MNGPAYSRDDLDFSDQLDAALRLTGFDTTLDRHGISGGEDWKSRLGNLIRDADTVAFVLSPSSARSEVCAWEVAEAKRLGKRIIPVPCRPLGDVSPPPQLADLNYIFFYPEPRSPGSGFGTGLTRLTAALNTDLDWLREHTFWQQRAIDWLADQRADYHLLRGDHVAKARSWIERRPKDAPGPTAEQLAFIDASEEAERRQQAEIANRAEREAHAAEVKQLTDRLERLLKYITSNDAGLRYIRGISREAVAATALLADTTDRDEFAKVAEQFWELYRGAMCFVELHQVADSDNYTSAIEAAMVRFGKELKQAQDQAEPLPLGRLLSFAHAVRIECEAYLGPMA